MLKSLGLQDFTRDQWRSTIRGRVNVHDDYRDIRNWVGAETADIVYHDHHGNLTQRLISAGYLGSAWGSHTPTYFIEVKATISTLETPFFCSQSQVIRMDDMRVSASGPVSNNIYLICRVFSLGIGTGLKIYFDPASLKSQGELEFKADKYTVTPRFRFSM